MLFMETVELNNANFYVFGSHFDYCKKIVSDGNKLKNFRFYNKKQVLNNPLFNIVNRLSRTRRCQHFFSSCNRISLFKKGFKLKRKNASPNYFIFFDSNYFLYDELFLKFLKYNVPNSKLILFFYNSFSHRNMVDVDYFKKYFNQIYSFDFEDCKKNGFIYQPGLYSKMDAKKKNRYDFLFVGNAKGKEEELNSIYFQLISCGFKVYFNVSNPKSQMVKGIKTKKLKYSKVSKLIQNSKCLVDVQNKNSNGLTIRFCEAVAYNKKLITNNMLSLNKNYNFIYKYESNSLAEKKMQLKDFIDKQEYSTNDAFKEISFLNFLDKVINYGR